MANMTIVYRLRFFLIFTLISSITIFNFVQAEQPAAQATGGPSWTQPAAAVSVWDGSRSVNATSANNGRANRQIIRSMDILHRPNRFGHFYGNTVRRRN
jgi:hypothetical protein